MFFFRFGNGGRYYYYVGSGGGRNFLVFFFVLFPCLGLGWENYGFFILFEVKREEREGEGGEED